MPRLRTHRYIYTDNVRPDPADKVYVFDLNRDTGREYFAGVMSKVLDAEGANYDTTQWDGFEILFVIGGGDFPRSGATARSGPRRERPTFSLMGGQFDSVRSSARTMHPHGECV